MNNKPFVKAFFGGLLGVLVALILVLGLGLMSKSGLAKLVDFANSLQPAVEGGQTPDPGENAAPDGGTAGGAAGGNATGAAAGVTPGTTIVVTDAALQLPEVVAEKCLPSVAAIDVYTYKSTAASGWTWGNWGWGGSSSSDGADEAERTLEKSSLGSGVVLTADGYVLTNFHVIEGADVLKVTVGDAEYDATVVGSDETSDLAVIKLDLPADVQLTPMAIGDSDALKQGQWVMTLGSPFGYGQSVATGVVSAFGRSTLLTNNSEAGYQAYTNLIQTDAAINPGNSGGALVNAAGELVGINTLITSYSGSYSGVGFAIPVNYAFAVAQDLISGRAPSHATLGASLVTLNASRAQRYGTAVTAGVYLADVFENTAASAAGLRIGDVVTAIDGVPMTDSADMLLVIRGHAVGDTITLSVNRDGQVFDVQVTLRTDAERELA